jgi:MFS family permease
MTTNSPSSTSPVAGQTSAIAAVSAPGFRWVVLGVATLAQTAASIVSQGIYTLVPFFQSTYQLSQAAAGLAISAVNGGQILSMMMLGWLIDRHGERRVVSITMIIMGLAAIAAGRYASSYPTLLIFLVLLGAAYASVQPGGTRAILRWFAPAQRGMATGVRQAGLPLGTALAALVLPSLAASQGWQAALMSQGVVGVLGGLLFALIYREDLAASVPAPASAQPSLREVVVTLTKYAALWPVMLAGVAMVTFQYTFATHVLTFLSARFGLTVVVAAMVYSVSQWVGIAGRIGLAWASDRLWPNRRVRSLAWTMAASVVALVALISMPAATPTWVLLCLFVVIGFFGVGWYPLYLLQVAEMAPKTAVAATVSFSMTMNMIAITIMPPVFGLIVDLSGYQAAWLVLVVLLVMSMINLGRGAERAEAARSA